MDPDIWYIHVHTVCPLANILPHKSIWKETIWTGYNKLIIGFLGLQCSPYRENSLTVKVSKDEYSKKANTLCVHDWLWSTNKTTKIAGFKRFWQRNSTAVIAHDRAAAVSSCGVGVGGHTQKVLLSGGGVKGARGGIDFCLWNRDLVRFTATAGKTSTWSF